MPKLKPDTQRGAPRAHPGRGERCFARAGFHRTTMHDICKEAGISPGALYVYFLEGGADRRHRRARPQQARRRARRALQIPDLLAALGQLGEHYAVDEPHHKRVFSAWRSPSNRRATRPSARSSVRSTGSYSTASRRCLRVPRPRAASRRTTTRVRSRRSWRCSATACSLGAIDPSFDGRAIMPVVMELVGALLNPRPAATSSAAANQSSEAHA